MTTGLRGRVGSCNTAVRCAQGETVTVSGISTVRSAVKQFQRDLRSIDVVLVYSVETVRRAVRLGGVYLAEVIKVQ